MKGISLVLLAVAGMGFTDPACGNAVTPAPVSKESKNVQIVMETSLGVITAELYPDQAPVTVSNLLAYIDARFYDGTVFHRVIDGFMIQGGGFTREMAQKKTRAPIRNEADNGLRNERGTLAMARTRIVDSATSQFFINLVDNGAHLDFKEKSDSGWGYCVFGRVIGGMEVVDRIAKVRVGSSGQHQSVPLDPVVVTSIRRKDAAPATPQ